MGDAKEPKPTGGSSSETEEEWVPEDDSIIGRAFRWSLMVIVGIGVLVAVGYYATRTTEDVKPEQEIVSVAPEAVVVAEVVPHVAFVDVTQEAGIDFVHVNGAYGEKLLPETMGGGTAFFDYDRDGDQDLLLVNSSGWGHRPPLKPTPVMALYRNSGQGTFENVTVSVGLAVEFYGMGVAVADYDGDGWTDIFFTAVGENRLFRNVAGKFTDVTLVAGVGGDSDQWSSGAGFFDYDRDGDLDLFVANYVRWSKEIDFDLDFKLTGVGRAYGPPQNYAGSHAYLYRNEGNGVFVDVSAPAGVQIKNVATGFPEAKALALGIVDIDGDGWMDIFVANDTVKNYFFHNLGDGTFEEMGELFGLAYGPNGNATGAMGTDVGHFRNDHNLGFMIGNFANEMTSVYVSQDDPTFFVDDAIGEGIGASSRLALTFGLFLFDYDLDGRLDMLQSNGHIETEINKMDPSQHYRQSAQLFWNGGASDGYVLVEGGSGDLATKIVGRGAAYADIDSDGDLDVILTQVAGTPLLLRNDQTLNHHWLRVKLVGKSANRDAIGAWV
ncbi:MAG: VCBS repeat-containing protein, partial [Candidatus Latescibacteria bacterium]|nr:VCBS repeat-containing protein [Candidatus Latescibacterota bacterium]